MQKKTPQCDDLGQSEEKTRRDLEERLRELSRQIKELEERTGQFQREASSGAHVISQLEATLSLEGQARKKLEDLVARQSAEIERWRQEAAANALRVAEAEKLALDVEAERSKLQAEHKAAMECAEAVRREGIEALEEAHSLNKPR